MRSIDVNRVTEAVRDLLLQANYHIGVDVLAALRQASATEKSGLGRKVLEEILLNDRIASEEEVAICQDTGQAVLFVDLGQDIHLAGGSFEEAVEQGVRQAYCGGYLRKSVVTDPLFERRNTGDNTPSVLHVRIVPGDKLKIVAAPKGFGSENMSAIRMLKPAEGSRGVKDFVVDTVRNAGPNPCPPIVVGVGVGGTFEKAAEISKRALLRKIGDHSPDPAYAVLEAELLGEINGLGIGPAGLGGTTTALAVNVEWYPTHIAGMPCAVNIMCHAARHAEIEL